MFKAWAHFDQKANVKSKIKCQGKFHTQSHTKQKVCLTLVCNQSKLSKLFSAVTCIILDIIHKFVTTLFYEGMK